MSVRLPVFFAWSHKPTSHPLRNDLRLASASLMISAERLKLGDSTAYRSISMTTSLMI